MPDRDRGDLDPGHASAWPRAVFGAAAGAPSVKEEEEGEGADDEAYGERAERYADGSPSGDAAAGGQGQRVNPEGQRGHIAAQK